VNSRVGVGVELPTRLGPHQLAVTLLLRAQKLDDLVPPVTCTYSVGDFVKGIREIADVRTTNPLVLRYKDRSSPRALPPKCHVLVHVTVNHNHVVIIINTIVWRWATLATGRLLARALGWTWYAGATHTQQTGTERPCTDPVCRARAQASPLPCAPRRSVCLFLSRLRRGLALAFTLGRGTGGLSTE